MKKLLIWAACLTVMASCSDVDNVVDKPVFGDATKADIVLKFSENTRATESGVGDENNVNYLEVYVFDAEGVALDTKVNGGATTNGEKGYVKFNEPSLTQSVGNDGSLKEKIEMSAGESKQVLVVANAWLGTPAEIVTKLKAQDIANGTTLWSALNDNASNLSLRAIMSLIRGAEMSNATSANGNTTSVPTFNSKKGFIMTGINLDADVEENKSDNKIPVLLDRNVSKIKMPVKANNVDTSGLDQDDLNTIFGFKADGTTPNVLEGTSITFNVTGFAVVNGLKQSTVGFVGKKATASSSTPGYGDKDYVYEPILTGNVYEDGYVMTYANEWTGWQAGKTLDGVWGTMINGVYNAVTPTKANSDELARGGRIESNSVSMKNDNKTSANLNEWYAYSGSAGNAIITDANKSVYVYESKPGLLQKTASADSFEGFDADDVISIILQGTLTATYGEPVASAQTKIRYWRIDVRPQDAFHITRNAVYSTSVSKITSPGYENPWEAEESIEIVDKPGQTSSEFIISVNEWTIKQVGNGQI